MARRWAVTWPRGVGSVVMLWKAGTVVPLPSLDSRACTAVALNNLDQAVGNCAGRGVIWRDGAVLTLNSLLTPKARAAGWSVTYPAGINDDGVIVTQVVNRYDPQRRVMLVALKPVVE